MKLLDGGTMFLLCVMFVGFIFAENAEAGEWQITMGSFHTGLSDADLKRRQITRSTPDGRSWKNKDVGNAKEWSEINPGIVYSSGNYYGGVIAQNSQGNTSIVGGYRWKIARNFDMTLGGATGYDQSTILPVIAGHYTKNNIRLSAVPYFGSVSGYDVFETDAETGEEKLFTHVKGSKTAGIAFAVSLVF